MLLIACHIICLCVRSTLCQYTSSRLYVEPTKSYSSDWKYHSDHYGNDPCNQNLLSTTLQKKDYMACISCTCNSKYSNTIISILLAIAVTMWMSVSIESLSSKTPALIWTPIASSPRMQGPKVSGGITTATIKQATQSDTSMQLCAHADCKLLCGL